MIEGKVSTWITQAEISTERAMARSLREHGSSHPVSVMLQHAKDMLVSARKLEESC